MPNVQRQNTSDARFHALGKWERWGLISLCAGFVAFGLIVEMRSAFMQRHMTDLGVYLRVGWAVRAGQDIYDVTDDNGWHYQYPPLFGILMAPLADAPPGDDRAGMIPYAASVALWYSISLACLVFGVHYLARALEAASADPLVRTQPRGCRRWWALRAIPVLACLPPIGHTLMRGQVNLLWLALLCATAASLVRGQRWRAGLWLSGAICLKVLPIFLLGVALWRRDWRCLAGAGLGMAVGLAVVPAAVFGVQRTAEYYQEYATKLLLPGLGQGTDQSRAKELIEMTANDSQSLQAALHNSAHLDRLTRPAHPSDMIRWTNRALGGLLTLLTLLAYGRRRERDGAAEAIFFGALILVMLLVSPVCHLHYFSLGVPLIMALLAAGWERARDLELGTSMILLLAFYVVGNALPNFPGCEVLRDLAFAMYPALLLWAAGCITLWRGRRIMLKSGESVPSASGVAA